MNRILLIFILIILSQSSNIFSQEKDIVAKRNLIKSPIIDLIPSEIVIENDTSRFVVNNVTVLNRGTGVLKIKSVTGSCYCSNGVIEKNDVVFLDEGKLRLEINKDGLENPDDTVEFTILSNAKNSPYHLKVKFVVQK